jgi:hypothetical protein
VAPPRWESDPHFDLGYHVRRHLTTKQQIGDLAVALSEDVLTIAGAWLFTRGV